MMTTIQADRPPRWVGPALPAGLGDLFTGLHVLVGVLCVLSWLVTSVAMVSLLSGLRGIRDVEPWGAAIAPWGLVVLVVTGASTAAWEAGPDVGLLALFGMGALVLVVGWFITRRERWCWAAYSAASRDGAEGAPQ